MEKLMLSGAAIDVLNKLHRFGPQEDGDLPSKFGMHELIEKGLAVKNYDNELPNSITDYGAYIVSNKLFRYSRGR